MSSVRWHGRRQLCSPFPSSTGNRDVIKSYKKKYIIFIITAVIYTVQSSI